MKKIKLLRFALLFLFLAALFAAGQAITFAWLSSFPEQAPQLESLEIKFWSYTVLSASLFIIDVVLLLRLKRQIAEQRHIQLKEGGRED